MLKVLLFLVSFLSILFGSVWLIIFKNMHENETVNFLTAAVMGVVPLLGGLLLIFKVLHNLNTYTNKQLAKILFCSFLVILSMFILSLLFWIIANPNHSSIYIHVIFAFFALVPLSSAVLIIRTVMLNRSTMSQSTMIVNSLDEPEDVQSVGLTPKQMEEKRIAYYWYRGLGIMWMIIFLLMVFMFYENHPITSNLEVFLMLMAIMFSIVFCYFLGTISFILIMPNFISETSIKLYLNYDNSKFSKWLVDKLL